MEKYIDIYKNSTGCKPNEELTGLYTPGFFFFAIENTIEEYRQKSKDLNFTLTAVDIDFFSAINKSEGYLTGDLLLQSFGKSIKEAIRGKDLATRLNSSTFLIFFNNLKPEEEYIAINRIRHAVSGNTERGITIGTGFAAFPDNGTNINRLKQFALTNLNYSRNADSRQNPIDSGSWIAVENINVLIVDNDKKNRKMLKILISPLKYNIILADSGESALEIVKKWDFDIILLDVMMPGLNGFEVCKILKSSEETWKIPVIMITALEDIESKIKGIEAGADDFIVKPPVKEELTARIKSLVRLGQLNRNYTSIENVLLSLANAVEAKDNYTQGHTERVSILAERLGRSMDLPEKDIIALRLGGILHDVGKIGISSDILNKPGPLDQEEWAIIKTHTDIGYNICLPLLKTLGGALDIVRHHHEKMDGSSYPDGLAGDSITLNSRILAVVDTYDALTNDRPYRKSMSIDKAIIILDESAENNLLDKKIVDVLVKLLGDKDNKLRRRDDATAEVNKRILIIGDDPLNFKVMKTLLQFNNFDVEWFKDANKILDAVSSGPPDLILMDIQLPGNDSLEAIRILKGSEKFKEIPVIAVSADAMEENKTEALEAGCSAYISKPLDTRTFANSVAEYM